MKDIEQEVFLRGETALAHGILQQLLGVIEGKGNKEQQ